MIAYSYTHRLRLRALLTYRLSRFTIHAVLLLTLLIACQTASLNNPLTGALPITAPSMTWVGEQIRVTIGPVTTSNGTPVGLIMVGAHGPRVYNTTFQAGLAEFTIPSDHTRQPGYVALIAAADQARGETSILVRSQRDADLSAGALLDEAYGLAGVSTPNSDPRPRHN